MTAPYKKNQQHVNGPLTAVRLTYPALSMLVDVKVHVKQIIQKNYMVGFSTLKYTELFISLIGLFLIIYMIL